MNIDDYDFYVVDENGTDAIMKKNIGQLNNMDVFECDSNCIANNFDALKRLTYYAKYSKDKNDKQLMEKPLGFTPDLIGQKYGDLKKTYIHRYTDFKNNIPKKDTNTLRIATYNVQLFNFNPRIQGIKNEKKVSEVINEINADVILLNEVHFNQQFDDIIAYTHITFCAPTLTATLNNALLSKIPFKSSNTELGNFGDHDGQNKCYIKTDIPQYNLIIYATHLDMKGKSVDLGNKQLEMIVKDAQSEYHNKNIIIMGDCNKKYRNDVYDSLQRYSIENNTPPPGEQMRESYNDTFKNILKDTKHGKFVFTDVFELREINPGLSHWSHRRIDYIFVNNKLIETFGINNITPWIHYSVESDHTPVIVDLKIPIMKPIDNNLDLSIEYTSQINQLNPGHGSSHDIFTSHRASGNVDFWWVKCGAATKTKKCSDNDSLKMIISECLASSLYQLFKVPVNKMYLIINNSKNINLSGKPYSQPNMLIGSKNIVNYVGHKDLIQKSKDGIFVDCLLLNWDAHSSNNTVITDTGEAIRIDVGGSLLYKAQGERKTGDLNRPTEHWARYKSYIQDKSSTGNIIHQMTKQETIEAYNKLLQVSDDDIKNVGQMYINKLNHLHSMKIINLRELNEMVLTIENSCAVVIKRLNYYKNNKNVELTMLFTIKDNYDLLKINKNEDLNSLFENLYDAIQNPKPIYDTQTYGFTTYTDLKKPQDDCIEDTINLQKIIFDKYTKHVSHIKKTTTPSAVILFGSPASGKTYCIRTLFANNKLPKKSNEYVYIDLDEIRSESKKARNMINGINSNILGSFLQPWIWTSTNGNLEKINYNVDIGKGINNNFMSMSDALLINSCRGLSGILAGTIDHMSLLNRCIKEKYNIIYDGSCSDWDQCAGIIDDLKGYDVTIVGVYNNNLNTVITEAKKRQIKDGRFMADKYITMHWKKINNNIHGKQIDDQPFNSKILNALPNDKSIEAYAKSKNIEYILINNTDHVNASCKIEIHSKPKQNQLGGSNINSILENIYKIQSRKQIIDDLLKPQKIIINPKNEKIIIAIPKIKTN